MIHECGMLDEKSSESGQLVSQRCCRGCCRGDVSAIPHKQSRLVDASLVAVQTGSGSSSQKEKFGKMSFLQRDIHILCNKKKNDGQSAV